MTTLSNIRTLVRRLTASPSPNQLSNDDIDFAVNTFYLDDLPQYLKLFDLKETYTFFTEPNVDTYALTVDPSFTATTPRAYYSVETPLYIAGYECSYTQSRSEFYRWYPSINAEDYIAGDGGAGAYTINITNTPVLRNNVTISGVTAAGVRLVGYDDGAGGFSGDITAGAIDYETGAITALTFSAAIPATENIYAQSVPYVAGRPIAVLFYDNEFTLRPVPDKTYRVEINAMVYPTVLLEVTDTPEPQFLWQLLGAGGAKKILEQRGDTQNLVENIMPFFEEQLKLCNRKTIQQNKNVRASTIYCGNSEGAGNLNRYDGLR